MAEPITQCPNCFTAFRVTADQLDVADGLVRCGACKQVFAATEHWIDEQTGAVADGPTGSEVSEAYIHDLLQEVPPEPVPEQEPSIATEALLDETWIPAEDYRPQPDEQDSSAATSTAAVADYLAGTLLDASGGNEQTVSEAPPEASPAEDDEAPAAGRALETQGSGAPAADDDREPAEPHRVATAEGPMQEHASTPDRADEREPAGSEFPLAAMSEADAPQRWMPDTEAIAWLGVPEPRPTPAPRIRSPLPATDPTAAAEEAPRIAWPIDEPPPARLPGSPVAAPPVQQHAEPTAAQRPEDEDHPTLPLFDDVPPAAPESAPDEPDWLPETAAEATEHDWQRLAAEEQGAGEPSRPDQELVDPDWLTHIEPPPVEMYQRPTRRITARLLVNVAAVGGLLLLLALQHLWFQRERLARDPDWRGFYETLCSVTGCELPGYVDMSRMRASDLSVDESADSQGVLLAEARISNRAAFAQPYPIVELSFSSIDGRLLARRGFLPSEYLADGWRAGDTLGAGASVRFRVSIEDPGPEAVNYRLRLRAVGNGR